MEQAPPLGNPEELARENQELRDKLRQYKALEEDLTAQRVFDKAKKQLTAWITFGGILLATAGFIGYRTVVDYMKELASKKLESVTAARLEEIIVKEGQRRIGEMVQQRESELVLFARQRIIAATEPIGARESASLEPVSDRKLDYTASMSPVREVGTEGSVVGFALAAAMEYQLRKKGQPAVTISPRFIYYYARQDRGSDSGALLSDAISALKTRGAVAEGVWPYRAGEFASPPPPAAEGAPHYKIAQAVRLSSLQEIKSALKTYGPVVSALSVYDSFMEPAKGGRIRVPNASDRFYGATAVCVVGFDDDQHTLKIRNNWGDRWGDHGYGYLPYAYADRFFSESWAIAL